MPNSLLKSLLGYAAPKPEPTGVLNDSGDSPSLSLRPVAEQLPQLFIDPQIRVLSNSYRQRIGVGAPTIVPEAPAGTVTIVKDPNEVV